MFNIKIYTYKLYPTKIQKQKINKTILASKLIYNKILASRIILFYTYKSYIKKCFELGVIPDSYILKEYNKMPNLLEIKNKSPFIKNVDNLALHEQWNNVNKIFNKYFNCKCKFPKFKKSENSYITNNLNNNIKIQKNKISLPEIGEVKIIQNSSLPDNYVIRRCIIYKSKNEEYYIKLYFISNDINKYDKKYINCNII